MPSLVRSMKSGFLLTAAAVAMFPCHADAQDGYMFQRPAATFSFRAGLAGPQATGEPFNFFTQQLSLNRGDFRTVGVAADVAFAVAPRVDIVLGIANDQSSNRSEFRDWLDQDDQTIQQTTELRRTPVTISGKFYLTSRGRSLSKHAWVPAAFTPYVTAGAGLMLYELKQSGDWVDAQTLDIFTRTFVSRGTGATAHVGGGAEWWLNPHLGIQADGRYAWGTASLNDDFSQFCATSGPDQCSNRIDLRGFQVTTGLAVRF